MAEYIERKCKDCKFFVQGERRSGTCEKSPYVTTRDGRPQTIQGKPRKKYVSWGTNACKQYFERKDENG